MNPTHTSEVHADAPADAPPDATTRRARGLSLQWLVPALLWLWLWLGLGLGMAPAHAHKPSDAYLTLQFDGALVQQRLDIALRDLDRELLLDADDDGNLTWGEVRARWPDIEGMAQAAVRVRRGDAACAIEPAAPTPQIQRHSDGSYAVLMTQWRCATAGAVSVDYRLFADSDPTHRAVVRVLDGSVQLANAVLVPGAPPRALAAPLLAARVPASGNIRLQDFFVEGVHHILAGTDHALFLLALLLPALLVRGAPTGHQPPALSRRLAQTPPAQRGRVGWAGAAADAALKASAASAPRATWRPAPALRPALLAVAGIVTAFTLAHSITLALSALDLIRVPSRWVESLIALSIIFAALNNIVPLVQRRLWLLTFAFGLIHGIGFAGVLADVGLQGRAMVPPLLAFNIGVEVGQLMIVGAWLLLAWPLRRHGAYLHLMRWGSVAVAMLALVWLLERALLLQVLPW
jgi:hypothetical protein